MSDTWPKIIRDPVHNIVPFDDTPEDRLLLNLINTKEFQRLRRIKQLGLSQPVFPGANHSRFAHSIGVLQVARRFLERVSRVCLLAACAIDSQRRAVVADAPPAVVHAFSGIIDLRQYLELDDHSLTEFAKACSRAADPVLSELAGGLLHRRLYKATDVTESLAPRVVDFTGKANDVLARAGYDVEFAFEYDAPSDTAYKLYSPDAEKPATQIYIDVPGGKLAELSDRSDSVRQIARKYTLVRYYYPAAVRDQIRDVAEPLLKKE